MCLYRKGKRRKILIFFRTGAQLFADFRFSEGGREVLTTNSCEKWWMRVHIYQTKRRHVPERHILHIYIPSDPDTSPSIHVFFFRSTAEFPTCSPHNTCTIITCVLVFSTWDSKRHDDNIIKSSVLCSTEWKSSGKLTACAKIETATDVVSSTTLNFSNWTKLCPLKPHIRINDVWKLRNSWC